MVFGGLYIDLNSLFQRMRGIVEILGLTKRRFFPRTDKNQSSALPLILLVG